MTVRFEDLRVRDRQNLDPDFFNRRFRLIVENLNELAGEIARVTTASDSLVTLGLARVNEVLGPALEQAQAAAESGFLVATSSTPLTLAVNLEATLQVDDTSARALFAPTPYVLIASDAGGVDDWAILEAQSYNRVNGGLAFKVVAVHGTIGAASRSDWVISATAGLAKSIMEAAADLANTLAVAQDAAADAAAAALAAQSAIASGPVSSVNGKTGVVALGVGDIPNLTALIAGKADATHGHTIAQIANLQSTLTALQSPDGGTY